MKGYLPTKNLIFFNPDISGVVYIHPANQFITVEQLLRAQEILVNKTMNPVIYIEDRRSKKRQHRQTKDYLSSIRKGKPSEYFQ